MSVTLLTGDALEHLTAMGAASVNAVCTDPPYGLKFMGRTWDHGVPGEPYWREVLRVLKPGGYLLAFGGTRTYHRLTCAIEDAGFEIRDCLMWLYGSGFPKGKGCLKPGWEPIVLARKPAPRPWLNVDGCRIEAIVGDYDHSGNDLGHRDDETNWRIQKRKVEPHTAGRWPANVVLSHISTAWYTLRDDISEDVARAITAYYSAIEGVRTLREDVPGHAFRISPPEVLQSGLCRSESQGSAQDRVGQPELRGVRQGVPGDAGVGEERPSPLLLAELPEDGASSESTREGAYRREPEADGRRGDRQVPQAELVAVEGRSVQGSGGLLARHDRLATGAGADVRTSDDEREVHPGASSDSSSQRGAPAPEGRSRPSHQRTEGRQPTGEPRGDAASGSQHGAPRDRAAVPVAHVRSRSAPSRECALAVPADLIPPGWLQYFVFAYECGCREIGTKRVKGNGRPNCNGRDYGHASEVTYGSHGGAPYKSRATDADGTETVAAWECVESCAVRMLDEQSGERKSGAAVRGTEPSLPSKNTYGTFGRVAGQVYADTGGASRFFFVSSAKTESGIIDAFESVNSAEPTSSQLSRYADSALDPVRADLSQEVGSQAHSTNGTPSESEPLSVSNTPAIPSSEPRYSPGSPLASIAQTIRANDAVQLGLTDITTTTGSPSTSGTCVGPAISSTTRSNSEPGAAALPIETEGTLRFRYCAKASPAERRPYNSHPTVKPLALCEWLVKLVTPPGGTVLDPFCGSGSVLIAADRLGFSSVGIDSDPHAIEIARRRVQEDAGPLIAEVIG